MLNIETAATLARATAAHSEPRFICSQYTTEQSNVQSFREDDLPPLALEDTNPMTRNEAENCLRSIRFHRRKRVEHKAHERRAIFTLCHRKGYLALDYTTKEECAKSELGIGERYLYDLLDATEVEAGLTAHLRSLRLSEEAQVLENKCLTENVLNALKDIPGVKNRLDVLAIAEKRAPQEIPRKMVTAGFIKQLAVEMGMLPAAKTSTPWPQDSSALGSRSNRQGHIEPAPGWAHLDLLLPIDEYEMLMRQTNAFNAAHPKTPLTPAGYMRQCWREQVEEASPASSAYISLESTTTTKAATAPSVLEDADVSFSLDSIENEKEEDIPGL